MFFIDHIRVIHHIKVTVTCIQKCIQKLPLRNLQSRRTTIKGQLVSSDRISSSAHHRGDNFASSASLNLEVTSLLVGLYLGSRLILSKITSQTAYIKLDVLK